MNDDVLRVIDANANRAREALRVVEDYARFTLDDAGLSAELKQIRHDLVAALGSILDDAILRRDTPRDVGVGNKTTTELARTRIADVVTAAAKRFGEALRTIDEFMKIVDPAVATQLESIRYRFYDIEHRIAFTLRTSASRLADVRLYVIVTESLCKHPWLETADRAINGGADCVQLREKELSAAELLDRARALVELCHRRGVLCIINDRPDVALIAKADGVHLGQDDLPAREVRKLVGNRMIMGVSTHSIEQAREAVFGGADYIGVGPVFRSETKPRDFLPGLDFAREVAREIRIPVVAIAGINPSNVDKVIATGIRAVAVSSAVISAPDPTEAAREIKSRLGPRMNADERR